MARRWPAIAGVLLAVLPAASAAAQVQAAADADAEWATVELTGLAETLTTAGEQVGGDPLRMCHVAAVLDVSEVELAASWGFMRQRLAELLEYAANDDEFGFLHCTGDDGETTWFIWRVEDGVPPGVGEVLAASARADVRVPPLVGASVPDGWDVPHLAQLPAWLWVEDPGWSTVTGAAALPGFGVSATVTASPVSSSWFVDDELVAICEQGQAWTRADGAADPHCGVTFTEPFESTLTTVVVYDVSVTCIPADLCAGITLDPIGGEVSRPVRAVEAWGAVTG